MGRRQKEERDGEKTLDFFHFFSLDLVASKKKKQEHSKSGIMDRLQRLLGQAGGGGAASGPGGDVPQVDTAEQIYISSLALLKMLKHGEREKA